MVVKSNDAVVDVVEVDESVAPVVTLVHAKDKAGTSPSMSLAVAAQVRVSLTTGCEGVISRLSMVGAVLAIVTVALSVVVPL